MNEFEASLLLAQLEEFMNVITAVMRTAGI